MISLLTVVLFWAEPTEKTTSPGVLMIVSMIGMGYRPGRHPLPPVPHTGINGLSPMPVTGSPDRCTSLSSPHTSYGATVRAGLSRLVDVSAINMRHGSWVKDFVSRLKKRVNTRIPPRALR
jgi:hypothetical protein